MELIVTNGNEDVERKQAGVIDLNHIKYRYKKKIIIGEIRTITTKQDIIKYLTVCLHATAQQ